MTGPDLQPCNFCGAEEMSNTLLRSDSTVEYLDGPPRASVPNTVLCYDCAQDVSDYLEERTRDSSYYSDVQTGKSDEEGDRLAPFGGADAQALLDRLVENEHLVLEPGRGSGYGIRAIDGEWKHAVFRAPGPATIETLTREEVRDRILSAQRLTIKRFDPAAWERFEREQ